MIFTGADYNMLYNYKFTKFTVFMRGSGKMVVVAVVGGCVLRLRFERSKGKMGYQN